jgi:hypothetical protein
MLAFFTKRDLFITSFHAQYVYSFVVADRSIIFRFEPAAPPDERESYPVLTLILGRIFRVGLGHPAIERLSIQNSRVK